MVRLALEHRQQEPQRLLRGAVQIHFAWVAQREHRRVDVDLDGSRGAGLGQELRPGEAGADHQQRVAAVHQVGARLGPEQADAAGDERQVVGQHRLAEQSLGDAGTEHLGDLHHLLGCAKCAGADQDRDFLARVQHLGGLAQVGFRRNQRRPRIAGTGASEAVSPGRCFERLLLHVLGDHDCRRCASRQRQPHRAVDHVRQLRRPADLLHILGDVGEQPVEVQLLLIARAAHGRLRLAANRKHRHVVRPRIVKTGDEVRCAGTAGCEADPELP